MLRSTGVIHDVAFTFDLGQLDRISELARIANRVFETGVKSPATGRHIDFFGIDTDPNFLLAFRIDRMFQQLDLHLAFIEVLDVHRGLDFERLIHWNTVANIDFADRQVLRSRRISDANRNNRDAQVLGFVCEFHRVFRTIVLAV